MVKLVSCWRQKKIQSEIYYNQHSMKKNPARCEVYLKRRFRIKKSHVQHIKKQNMKPARRT
ncbi:hypothetical protein SPOG_01164 [Schizosaccharomyces cryophilus OY26]|uniref:Uncharacterized protein n=1 Tax=Schizosaccharomyces cryophilus (strain OY26 / ATCC MYA-4695 / CBS 11777 / NBRC 106824 / NRRL Y48691) TaxID=653667 RepID=S9X9J4_SCHCR|nr:uncharacterized protein SPOG_01164 [Schizosaccharomyces cryophilus OY26]EPY50406.1 hypothetical protein SPOG_01164 [Schizosaccharomyces cryophilus OY26]